MESTMCMTCGNIGMCSGGDGFYYCLSCATQSQDLMEQAIENDELVFQGIYNCSFRRTIQAPVQSQAEVDMRTQVDVFTKLQKVNMTGDQSCAQTGAAIDLDDDVPLQDFGSQPTFPVLDFETLASEIRERYLEGMQIMIQMQCESLVEKMGVSPLICGVIGPIWLRFVASTHVLEQGWATEVLQAADALYQNHRSKDEGSEYNNLFDSQYRRSAKFNAEPRSSLYRQKARIVWIRSLNDRLPVAISLAVLFLACHIAREAILPTDIIKWVLEGKIPYLAAFVDIEKMFSSTSKPCPVGIKFMLRPSRVLAARQLELMSGFLAKRICLQLPPVNFHSISCRFVKQLGLPADRLFPALSRMHEWSLPPGLWLSADNNALPTRLYVMSMLVVVIRILYNIHGQGYYEKSMSTVTFASSSSNKVYNEQLSKCKLDKPCSLSASCVNNGNIENSCFSIHSIANSSGNILSSSTGSRTEFQEHELDAAAMLQKLESWHQNNNDQFDYGKDLSTYLKYCKDVIFAGSKMSNDEEALVKHFWQLYEKLEKEDLDLVQETETNAFLNLSISNKRHKNTPEALDGIHSRSYQRDCKDMSDAAELEFSERALVKQDIGTTIKDIPLRTSSELKYSSDKRMESIIFDMEQHGFQYIRPTRDPPPDSYLCYKKKNTSGKSQAHVHADYYILLRACARVVKIKPYVLHKCILQIEKRLGWIEDRITGILQEYLLTQGQRGGQINNTV